MIFAIILKNHVVNIDILGIIISKLHYKKKLCPIILFEIDKSSKINFYYTILLFDLIVYLKLGGSKEFLLDVKKIVL